MFYIFIFFFKQKTAYEMRISDWSSDVCSSDLRSRATTTATARRQDHQSHPHRLHSQKNPLHHAPRPLRHLLHHPVRRRLRAAGLAWRVDRAAQPARPGAVGAGRRAARRAAARAGAVDDRPADFARPPRQARSEEHTSELQSLMRISYAVLCLKKKKTPTHLANHTQTPPKNSTQIHHNQKNRKGTNK